MLDTWKDEFLMNNSTFSLLIGMITCFLDGPLVVIWILGFGLDNPLTMLLIWSIFSTLRVGTVFLSLRTSAVLTVGFVAWAYNLLGFDLSLDLSFEGLLFLRSWQAWFQLSIVRHGLHQRVKVCRLGSELYKYENLYIVHSNIDFPEWPWLQLMCYTICLL